MTAPLSPGDAVRTLRLKAGLTQSGLAERLGKPQSYVSKLESQERSLHVEDLQPLAAALGVYPSTILNAIEGTDSILDRWEISEATFSELARANGSMRGMIMGYVAEDRFTETYLKHRKDLTYIKDDDHDRRKKGDSRIHYKGRDITVEIKSLQTNHVKIDRQTGRWTGKAQVDASDRREIFFDDGTSLETTLLLRGEFDILAINCWSFGEDWKFAFALNRDLQGSTFKKYTPEQRAQLLASMQTVTWPLEEPYTANFEEILDRAWREYETGPDVKGVASAD